MKMIISMFIGVSLSGLLFYLTSGGVEKQDIAEPIQAAPGILVEQDDVIEDKRSYHVRFRLSDCVIENLKNVTGVGLVLTLKYRISIYRGKAFHWDEVQPAIIKILKNPDAVICPEEDMSESRSCPSVPDVTPRPERVPI